MKLLPIIFASVFSLTSIAAAGGIKGRVVDENGYPLRNVVISVKGFRQTTTTDLDGRYTLKMPDDASSTRVNVYVNSRFAVLCLVPEGNADSVVNVTLIRR